MKEAVFLKKVSVGFGARIREGTILEEEASVAHSVDLKQTILFPFVTLGSLINFCDCLMAGGTSRKDHSEVGSSYIHFNYTPHQDKATPSLMGDVPHGVMLNQQPIFLGGQGGVVGPCRLAFGTIIAAGTIQRSDELRPGRLIIGQGGKAGNIPVTPGMFGNLKKIVMNNIISIANLMALRQWYFHVRPQFVSNEFLEALLDGLKEKLHMATEERIKRFGDFCQKTQSVPKQNQKAAKSTRSSINSKQKQELFKSWSDLEIFFKVHQPYEGDSRLRDTFLEKIHRGIKASEKDYLLVIKGLRPDDAQTGTRWLQGIVDQITQGALKIIPSFGPKSV